ncbi:unnamed protein product [Brachionus calyciflorus]|uniref:Uncharacterized protein n=1 Tax=Brachionus calyciflorus TaxID=104777 RepID=A0A814JQL2_9BILA|nr:unnamed protein product [Brachionus calyciflorus]
MEHQPSTVRRKKLGIQRSAEERRINDRKAKRTQNHGLVVKPIKSSGFNERMQIDLIDFRTLPDGEYCWILNCHYHFTKYCFLIALKNKTAIEVAKGLITVFCIIGASRILQSKEDETSEQIDDNDIDDENSRFVVCDELLKIRDELLGNKRKDPEPESNPEKAHEAHEYEIDLRAGVLDAYIAFNCIEKTSLVTDFSIEDIPTTKNGAYFRLSSREAVRILSVGHGPGFLKCNCTGNCATNRCSCRRSELKCSS